VHSKESSIPIKSFYLYQSSHLLAFNGYFNFAMQRLSTKLTMGSSRMTGV